MARPNKRKTSPVQEVDEGSAKRRFIESETTQPEPEKPNDAPDTSKQPEDAGTEPSPPEEEPSNDAAAKAKERQDRFKALQARQNASRKQNLKESQLETQRLATDPNLLTALNRKHAIASHKLLKADTAAEGGDFERKRAWDWTVEESEKWDRRMEKKGKHRDDVAFQDYTQDARKVYKRQMKGFKPDLESYERSKMEAIQQAAANGGLDILETENGELIAVDKDGTFYSTEDNTDFVRNRPEKEAVDRLVGDIKKAEEQRLKKRRARQNQEEDGDVTYINVKNKQFNEKLKRFYDKYTTDIRESFERGTAM